MVQLRTRIANVAKKNEVHNMDKKREEKKWGDGSSPARFLRLPAIRTMVFRSTSRPNNKTRVDLASIMHCVTSEIDPRIARWPIIEVGHVVIPPPNAKRIRRRLGVCEFLVRLVPDLLDGSDVKEEELVRWTSASRKRCFHQSSPERGTGSKREGAR